MSRYCGVVISAVLYCSTLALGQQYPFIQVTKPGDPSHLGPMLEDSKGRLWVGGQSGAAIYDGARFFSISDLGMREGPPDDRDVRGFAEDDEGGVWICSFGGIYRFQGGRLQLVLAGACTSIVRAAPGIMLAALDPNSKAVSASAYLYRFRRKASLWETERIPGIVLKNPTPSNVYVTVDHEGAALYPCSGGWCELSANTIRTLEANRNTPPTQLQHAFPFNYLKTIVRDRFNCLWFVTVNDGYEQCPDDPKPMVLPAEFTNINIVCQELSDGRMLITSEGGGLAIGRPGKYQFATPRNALPDSQSALVGRDGTIWVAGDQGLFRFASPFRMEYWTSHDGSNGAFAIARLGAQMVAGSGKDIVALDPDRSRWSTLPRGHGLGTIMQLLPSGSHTLFAVLHRQPNSLVEIAADGGILRELPGVDRGSRLLLTTGNQLWLASRGASAIQRVNIEKDRLVGVPEHLPGSGLNAMEIQESGVDGSLWTCYQNGLAVRRQAAWEVAANEGAGLMENSCSAMAIDAYGDIWYGYLNLPGLARIHFPASGDYLRPQIQNHTNEKEVGLTTQFICIDKRGWIWVGTDQGVLVATRGQAEKGEWWRLNATDGLPSVSTNQEAFMLDADGSIWFAADSNIVHFNPQADFVQSTTSPVFFLSAFSSNGGLPRLADLADSFKSGASIIAHVGSLQFDRRNALAVRYRLLPEGAAWQETSTLDLNLGLPHWGAHTLEIQARLGSGPWSATTSHPFTVLKPMWLTWPFLLGFMIAGLAGGGTGVAWYRKREERRRKVLPDLTEWRLSVLSPEIQSLEGEVLDARFEVGRVLARGGFATVAEGRDLKEGGRRCAVKIFRQEWADKEWMAKRFRHEIQALEQIDHPNVVRIYGHGSAPNGAPYLVMEFVEGRTLREVVEKRRIALLAVASYLRQIGSALNEIHLRGVCHRDLKPENLMIRDDAPAGHEIVLIDFSIAIVKDPDETLHGLSRAAGTLHYMAPEQGIGYADASTDIYSLAKILIEMLTGERLSALLPDASIDLPQRVRGLLAGLPLGLSSLSIDLIARALEFHPLSRASDASGFADTIAKDLERHAGDGPEAVP